MRSGRDAFLSGSGGAKGKELVEFFLASPATTILPGGFFINFSQLIDSSQVSDFGDQIAQTLTGF